jgi:probable rRNA maturation factor
VIVTDVLGRPVRDPGIRRWLQLVAPPAAVGEVGIVLATDAASRRLNRQFAGKDRPTDVLSFPAAPDVRRRAAGSVSRRSGRPVGGAAANGPAWLGDVVIAIGVSRRQARAARHAWRTELRVLALHGLLHLLGYDHTAADGPMARLERRLRERGGLRQALIERAETKAVARQSRRKGAPR